MAATILAPLKKALDIEDIYNHVFWERYFRVIFALATSSTWENHLQWKDPADAVNIDRLQVYEDIRFAPNYLFPNRPLPSDVPIHRGGVHDQGRRELRQVRISG